MKKKIIYYSRSGVESGWCVGSLYVEGREYRSDRLGSTYGRSQAMVNPLNSHVYVLSTTWPEQRNRCCLLVSRDFPRTSTSVRGICSLAFQMILPLSTAFHPQIYIYMDGITL